MELRIAYFLFLVFVLNYSNSQGRLRTRPRHRDIRGEIEGNITGDTYSPDLTSVIPGSSSLAFVFDVTGSMWDDLKQVTAGAQEILDTTRSRAEQPLHNYVLIPFHDPVVGPTIVTSDPHIFTRAMRDLYVQGGGDCPEMSVTAIREALLISLPGSFIYVFTDARSKDYRQLPDVLKIIQRKQSQVVFVLTGDCDDQNHRGYKAYEKIAATSSGQVFLITKEDVSKVVKFIEVSVQAHKVLLLATDHSRGGRHDWVIPFDPELQEITIALSGPGRSMTLVDPDGFEITEENGLETLLNLENVQIVNMKTPKPGLWRLSANSTSEHSLRVTGLSTLDFRARFSRKPTLNWNETEFQPVEGIPSYILINASGLEYPGKFRRLRLLDIAGRTIRTVSLSNPRPDQPYLYTVRPMIMPHRPFYLVIFGTLLDGYRFIRASKTAVIQIKPVAPVVDLPDTYPGYFEYPAEIPCQITSLIPYHVTWSRKVGKSWVKIGKTRTYNDSTTDYLRIDEVSEESEGLYKCFANNSKGRGHDKTFLDVEERPPILTTDGNITATPGEEVVLTCHVTSNVAYTITWSRIDGEALSRVRARKLRNGSLLIQGVRGNDEGVYQCTVVNLGGETTATIPLIVQRPPEVRLNPSERSSFSQGSRIRIECVANGLPPPTLEWLRDSTYLLDIGKIRISRGGRYLEIINAGREDEGMYTCQASNRAGSDSASVVWFFTEIPVVTIPESEMLVLEGTSVTILCEVNGIPQPRVTWSKDGRNISPGRQYEINPDGSLIIHHVARSNTGLYVCTGTNSAGSDSGEVRLQVGWAPIITNPPRNVGFDFGSNATLPCEAEGFPTPTITWSRGTDAIRLEETSSEESGRTRQLLDTNSLFISNLNLVDEGLYTCSASNMFSTVTETAQLTVTGTVSPKIDVGNLVPHVIVGQTLVIPCRIVAGNPPPTRQWTRRLQVFEPTRRVKLSDGGNVVITNTQVSDAGPYVCAAFNAVGRDERRVDVDVWVPPQIQRGQTRYNTIEGNSVTLRCVASGNPKPEITWTRIGSNGALNNLEGFKVSDEGLLTISNPTGSDKTVYTCTASNSAGSDSIDLVLDVYLRPRLDDNTLDHYSVVVGDSVTMECQVTVSDPPPTYTWAKDGIRLSGDEENIDITSNGRLTLTSAEVSDAGRYVCVASNIAGTVQRDMDLDVLVPPRIRRGPSLVKVLESESTSLTCHASGLPTPVLTWKRGEIEINADYDPRFTLESRDGSLQLHIDSARLSDDDEYVCVARNNVGFDFMSVTLDVQKLPVIGPNANCIPSLENNQCTATPVESGSLTLTCNATGDPPPTISWYKDGEKLTNADPNVRIDGDGTLTLFVVTSDDNGQYICEAQNERGIITKVTNVEVHERPEIDGNDGEIQNLWVLEGEDIDLLCEADAVPPPVITWYKGEEGSQIVLEEAGHIAILNSGTVLQVTNARISDSNLYVCNATNRVGQTTKYIRLDVYVRPSITDSDDVSVHVANLNDPVDLHCYASGIPFPDIEWYKGLNRVEPDNERIQLLDRNQILRINSARVTDTSSYKCIVTNRVGDESKFFDLAVHVPPSIRGGNRTHVVTLDEDVTIQCITSGIPQPSVQWYFSDLTLTSRPGLRLTSNDEVVEFRKIKKTDEGAYRCTAHNSAGEDTRTHVVVVRVPPSIDGEDESNVTVKLGGDVTLTCNAAGDPPPTIVWMKDGTPVIFSLNDNIRLSSNNKMLIITNARESDKGEYQCIASNDVGDETQTHVLDVLVPPVIDNPQEVVVVVEHETAILRCQVYAHPFPQIRWETFGNPIIESEKFQFTNQRQSLIINNALVGDAKEYSCTARNSVGRATKQVNLVVHVPAIITYPDDNRVEHTVVEDESYELRCVANGIPIPEITWYKDGILLADSNDLKLRDGGRVLLISKADVENHEGAYECVANNLVGDDSREMSLVVYVPPQIHGGGKTTNKVINIGRSEELECRIKRGKPTPEIRWYNRENQEIDSSRDVIFTNNKERMLILNAQLGDVGNYWCEATNVAGKSRKDFNLDVIVPPSITGEGETTQVSVVLDGNITLVCHVTGIPTPVVRWEKEGRPISSLRSGQFSVSAGGSRLTVTSAREEDAGLFQCIATNNAGSANKTYQLDVFLPPSVVGDGIENITVVENSPVTMMCEIEAFPPPQITWFKNSRPLLLGPGTQLSINNKRLDILWAQEQDTGLYHCEAVNVVGKQQKFFRLKVHVVPTIAGPSYTRIEHVVGDQIRLICDYDGVPRPSIEWTKDDGQISDPAVVQSDGRVLLISSAQVQQSGLYVCEASNVAGSDVKTYEVVVYEPPSITGSGDDNVVIVNRGDEIVLECLVRGTPQPEVVWRKNRQTLSNIFARAQISTNGRYLTIEEGDLEDAGKYVCTATNLVGVADKRFEVEVRVPPTIRSSNEVEHRWVVRRNNISLSCDADAIPPPSLQWLVNGIPLVPSPRLRTEQGGKVLFLSFAKGEDAAIYTCVASNVAGTASRDIQLDVYSTPSIPGSDVISTHDVNRGRSFTLECNVVGHPTPDVEWLKDGYKIASTVLGVISTGFEMSTDGKHLRVESAELQHTGDYTCRAVNQAGEDSKQHKVNVRVPPSISDEDSSPGVIHTHVNTPTLLRCSAYGIPSPTIQWLKDGELIEFEDNDNYITQFGGRYLRISNTKLSDQGSFTCIASNPAGDASKSFELVVNVPPVIEGSDSLTPTSVGVPTNQSIVLSCVITAGNPFPNIIWWNGRKVLEESFRVRLSADNQTIEVLESRVSDTGRYRCTATNDAGEDSKSFDVEVQTPPQFRDGEEDSHIDVNEGSPLHIHCKIVAVPMPELTWFKDGRPLVSSDDVYIFPGGRTLQIVSAEPMDAGRYTCVATNDVGSDEKDTDVTVNVPPTIGDGDNNVPEVVRKSVDSTFTLQCLVAGNPTPTITWYKNGRAINDDNENYELEGNGQLLTVIKAQQQDSGHYDCRAKNKAGQDSKVFHVNIQTGPSISGPAYERKIATQNTAVVMPCDASGIPSPTITWLKDGTPLNQANSRYAVLSQGSLLIITQVQTTDSGNFTCVASNVVGKARKTYEVLTYVAPVLPTTSGDISVDQGETAILSCETFALPQPTVQWTKNGVQIDFDRLDKEEENISLSDDHQILFVMDAKESDTGRYMCVVSNDAGIQSKNFKVSVNVPPSIAGPPEVEVTSVQGSALTLFCDVYAVPKATITWMKNGDLVRSNSLVTILPGGNRLQIGSTEVRDTGSYTCHADNGVGEARKLFNLIVQVPPSIITPESEVTIVEYYDETIQCLVYGLPNPEITWFRNGVEIRRSNQSNLMVSADRQTLTIFRAQLTDVGEYVCEAENVAGKERGSVNVHVIVPPTMNDDGKDDHIEVNAGNSVTMFCNVTGGIPSPSVSWLRNGIPLAISDRLRLLSGGKLLKIIQSQETDTATYRCIASNEAGRVSDQFELVVRVPPTFQSSEDSEITVFAGESVMLDCTVLGTPFPSVAWSKNESPIRGLSSGIQNRVRTLANSQQIRITRTQVSDTGRYTCLAVSSAGQANKNFKLNVYEPTRIAGSDETPHIVVNVGDEIDLICDASGVPEPVLGWVKNGDEPLLDNSRVLNQGRRMFVESAQLSDSGTYTCVATSPAGVAEKDFDVTVNQPPTINDRGIDVMAVVGENVTLECRSNAYPPPVLSWYKNGRPLDKHERFLNLINVQVSHTGDYTCTATNVAGSTSQDFHLSVYQPPSIDSGLSRVVAIRGDTVKLPCVVRGIPKPRVTWRKGSEQVSRDRSSSRFEFLEEGSLMIEYTTEDDSGRYVCLVSNSAGSDRRIIELEVQVPTSIQKGATNVTVSVNNPVTLECEVEGIPQPVVTWTKGGVIIQTESDPSYSVLGSGSLRIASASTSNTDLYQCTAVNDAGSDHREISLFVQVPPSISVGLNKVTKTPGDNIRLSCDVSGTPEPTVVWSKNGVQLTGTSRAYVDESNGLVIPSIRLDDDALYRCTATNDAGSARREIELEVHDQPTILNSAERLIVFQGQSITLPCEVSGVPLPTVTWRKGAIVISSRSQGKLIRSDNSLRIISAQADDAGSYTCVAQNSAGVTTKSTYLDVFTPPQFDTELPLSKTVAVGESLLLSLSVLGHPEPDITWYKNGVEIESEDGSLQLPVISLDDEGLYSVTARNPAGAVTRYMRLIVNAAPDITADVDHDVVVNEGEQINLAVDLSGKPWPSVTWTKDGEEIIRSNLRLRLSNSGSLFIQNARSSDSGHYIGTAVNVAGRASVDFDVLVQVAPVITEAPTNVEVNSGDFVELECAATGIPTPTIQWKFKNQVVPGTITDSPGRSRLVIEHARPQDTGAYICEARNPADVRVATGFVTVKSPPKFLEEMGSNQVDSLGGTSMLHCPVEADPLPTITWTKDGQEIEINERTQLFSNGSLMIYDTVLQDVGTYTCIAFNDAGSIERSVVLVLQRGPVIEKGPSDVIVDVGRTFLLDCIATGEPSPTIEWSKGSEPITFNNRISLLRNNSLRVVASRLQDTGEYECVAINFKGADLAAALVTIRVHGGYSEWSDYGSCSTSCGSGVQTRHRLCNNPPPANGGRDCVGPSEEEKSCRQSTCPIDGGYGQWSYWEECSATCGTGMRSRSRECNRPSPQFGGLPCSGPSTEQAVCVGEACAVDGEWSNWQLWLPCTASCGEATQIRVRHCNNPPPSGGGSPCFGRDTMTRLCNNGPCPVNGNWAQWLSWARCTVSCGGGTRTRTRTCSDPAPSNGGLLCAGPNQQMENCNTEPCAVNGNWVNWGPWTECSRSCGGGQRNRYRSCTNPAPKHGGRFCYGSDSEFHSCGLIACPIDGNWSPWQDWGECSQSCGFGQRTRTRLCNDPRPSNDGQWCVGDATQTDRCREKFCSGGPRDGVGVLFGTINDVPFGISDIVANGSDIGDDATRIMATIYDIPPTVGHLLQTQISMLGPIFWTMAREIEGAYNGFSLTEGVFDRNVSVEFANGDMVRMFHKAKGLNSNGKMQIEVAVEGNVPEFQSDKNVEVFDYFEDYVQVGPGALFAYSNRFLTLDDFFMPYSWRHNITYDSSRGRMPYLVEQLSSSNIIVQYDPSQEELFFQADVTIGKGDPSDQCPEGFLLDRSGMYCLDEDECSLDRSPCSHQCTNIIGSFICGCPDGFSIGPDGTQCEDINECETGQYLCAPTLDCLNTLGSYKCVITCSEGFKRSENGRNCEDINECDDLNERVCTHVCLNTIGSYRCECRHGYRLSTDGQCIDINECLIRRVCRADQRCENNDGGYRCIDDCPTGMEKERGVCVDVNECTTGRHECGPGMLCQNTEGGYNCACPPGFKASGSEPPCTDINECVEVPGICQHSCRNSLGSYQCVCPEGYRLAANKRNCEDIDECAEGLMRCLSNQMCFNKRGSVTCINTPCPPSYIRVASSGYCVKQCFGPDCQNKPRYGIEYKTVALPFGIGAHQDLVRLAVYTNDNELHLNTRFVALNTFGNPFGIRTENYKGVVFTTRPLKRSRTYHLEAQATSLSDTGRLEYQTKFIIYISVAAHEF